MSNVKYFAKTIQQQAKDQVEKLISLPAFQNSKVRIMPDVHAGAGCVIGFTADLGDKVIPNVVGVDIGCGMLSVNLGKIDIDLAEFDIAVKKVIPAGMQVQKVSNNTVKAFIKDLHCFNELKNTEWLYKSIGTLGGGNHFIELDKDSYDNIWLIVHTGSRNLGKQVADIYQRKAIETCEKKNYIPLMKEMIDVYTRNGWNTEINHVCITLKELMNKSVIPNELCYLEGQLRQQYLDDMDKCITFATMNRECIVNNLLKELNIHDYKNKFHTIHNYIDTSMNIVKKGAVCSLSGIKLVIPMNMRDGTLLCAGKGNKDWNYSAPHGAGRIMSRTQAKSTLTVEEFTNSMNGIYTTTANEETIDEAPMAYKPMKQIVELISDTVEVLDVLKPIYNFKASE